MSEKISPQALLEISELTNEAERILAATHVSKSEATRAQALLQRAGAIKSTGMSTLEAGRIILNEYRKRDGLQEFDFSTEARLEHAFRMFLRGSDKEIRDLSNSGDGAGNAISSIFYTEGSIGGFLVPTSFQNDLMIGMAQVDPVIDKYRVTLIQENDFELRPKTYPGVDWSTITVQDPSQSSPYVPSAGEAVQAVDNGVNSPLQFNVSGPIFNPSTYRALLKASHELEEDSFRPIQQIFTEAFSIGIGRKVGGDIIDATLLGAKNSGYTTATSGVLSLADFNAIYFSVNRFYRASSKCAWLMNDATYKLVRSATDNSGRPLLDTSNDNERLLGKPVLVSPTVPAGSGARGIIFGDLSHLVVRASRMRVQRIKERFADFAQVGYLGLQRFSFSVFDPTNGTVPPIVSALLR